MSTPPAGCDIHNCPNLADWAIYPDHRRRLQLVINLCDPHHDAAVDLSGPRRDTYTAANRLIRQSLA